MSCLYYRVFDFARNTCWISFATELVILVLFSLSETTKRLSFMLYSQRRKNVCANVSRSCFVSNSPFSMDLQKQMGVVSRRFFSTKESTWLMVGNVALKIIMTDLYLIYDLCSFFRPSVKSSKTSSDHGMLHAENKIELQIQCRFDNGWISERTPKLWIITQQLSLSWVGVLGFSFNFPSEIHWYLIRVRNKKE